MAVSYWAYYGDNHSGKTGTQLKLTERGHQGFSGQSTKDDWQATSQWQAELDVQAIPGPCWTYPLHLQIPTPRQHPIKTHQDL